MHSLDKEIEKEENRAKEKQDEGRVNVPARKPAERSKELNGYGFEPGLFAYSVKWADDRIAGKAAAKGAELIVDPNSEVRALTPNQGGTQGESDVPKQS